MVVEQAASETPIETRVAPDGVGYTWAEFESYFDADIAAAIWEAAEIDAAPEPTPILISPCFELASIPCTLRESSWRRSLISLMIGEPSLLLLLSFLHTLLIAYNTHFCQSPPVVDIKNLNPYFKNVRVNFPSLCFFKG